MVTRADPKIGPLVSSVAMHGRRRSVDEALAGLSASSTPAAQRVQGQGWACRAARALCAPRRTLRGAARLDACAGGTTPTAQHPAGRNQTMGGHEFLHAGHQVLRSRPRVWQAEQHGNFFLDLDDQIGFVQAGLQSLVSRVSCAMSSASHRTGIVLGVHAFCPGRASAARSATSRWRRQGAQRGTATTPLAAHQRTDLARLGAAVSAAARIAALVSVEKCRRRGNRHDSEVRVGRHEPAPPIRAHLQSPSGLLAMRPYREGLALRAWKTLD